MNDDAKVGVEYTVAIIVFDYFGRFLNKFENILITLLG